MTILDADLNDLKRRGYDGNAASDVMIFNALNTLQLTLS